MGIINITPDSFSQDGCLKQKKDPVTSAVNRAQKFARQGAHIIDIGGESSRPGSSRISVKEEIKRVLPSLKILVKKNLLPISIDTYKPTVAKHALDAGAAIVNNIKGNKTDTSLLKMVRDYNAAIILMHMKGTPKSMQRRLSYKNLIIDIIGELRKSVENCLEIGIKSDKIIIDPGIGFGKSVAHNLEIIKNLDAFKVLRLPVLIGTSRKSFIGNILNKDIPQRLMGTAATVCASILNGAHIVRVHDVKEIADCCKMTDAIINYQIDNN
ncbi:MAG: dihydropteroate synthase [Candidatus Omnitrophica bacterium]|nr:dihydropteroate synthase [Candidatus Omnitrophota bacterium]